MSLLPWFLKIPGHDQNVRIPSAPFRIAAREDTAATDEPPMTFTWGSTPGSEWDFSFGIPIKQGIPGPIDLKLGRKRVRPSTIPSWQYHGPTRTQLLFTEADVYYSDLAYEMEVERQRQTDYSLGWSWQWGYSDETLPLLITYV